MREWTNVAVAVAAVKRVSCTGARSRRTFGVDAAFAADLAFDALVLGAQSDVSPPFFFAERCLAEGGAS